MSSPGYRHFVLSERGIESGWEYREDARDAQRESGGKLLTRRGLLSRGIDPDNDSAWVTGPSGSTLFGMSDEQIRSAAHAVQWSPLRDLAQAHVTRARPPS